MTEKKELWLMFRQALLMMVDAIERYILMFPDCKRTAKKKSV